jgi:hypothetical protein
VPETVEAQHEQSHECDEENQCRVSVTVIEQRSEHPCRNENQIRQRVRWRDDATHLAAIEFKEQRHDRDVHDLRHDRHDQERTDRTH